MSGLPLEVALPGRGTLALVGSGEYLTPMEPVDRFLFSCLAEPARVVCLPTAAGMEGDERVNYWCDLGEQYFRKLGAASVTSLRLLNRADALDETLAAQIHAANFVYLSGGKPHYLRATLEGTLAWSAIKAVLAAGGVVAGCSAGAMIFGASVAGSPFPWSWEPGFGLLKDALILPHYDELPQFILAGFAPFASRLTIVGIEGNTALVCTLAGSQVHGAGGVTLTRSSHKLRYTP